MTVIRPTDKAREWLRKEHPEVPCSRCAYCGTIGERGNAAKLREALEKIHTIAKTFIDATKMRRVTDSARLDVSNIKDLADAALATLAAPPRNCDRFATVDEARKAHEEYRGDYIMRASNKFDFPMKFEAWLFAPATEGGAK